MPEELLEASVTLVNNKLKFSGVAEPNPSIIIDYIPPLGDGEGYTPLELVLVSLSACSGSTVVSLLRKMKTDITSFKVNAQGIKRDTHPMSFRQISLKFLITSPNAKPIDIEKAIRMSEEKYCPVWAMLKGSVEIKTDYQIAPP